MTGFGIIGVAVTLGALLIAFELQRVIRNALYDARQQRERYGKRAAEPHRGTVTSKITQSVHIGGNTDA